MCESSLFLLLVSTSSLAFSQQSLFSMIPSLLGAAHAAWEKVSIMALFKILSLSMIMAIAHPYHWDIQT